MQLRASSVIESIRLYTDRTPFTGETVGTDSDARFSTRGKQYSDEDLLQRICDVQLKILSQVDICHFIHDPADSNTVVIQYAGSYPILDSDVFRVLENRVFVDGNRAIRIAEQTSRAFQDSCRAATSGYPAYTLGGGYLRTYPTAGVPSAYVVIEPREITPADLGAGTDVLGACIQLGPAIVHGVATTIHLTNAEEGIDITEQQALAAWHNRQYEKYIIPFRLRTKLTSYRDSEISVERHSQ